MAATKSLSIRIDADLKKESENILSQLGLPTSTAVSMLLKTIVRNRAIPPALFTIDTKEAANRAYLEKLEKSFAEYEAGLAEPHELLEEADA